MNRATMIRRARPSDAESVAALSGELGYPTTAEEGRDRLGAVLQEPDHAIFVADGGADEVIGWVHVYGARSLLQSGVAVVGGLVVGERHRGRGVGTRLLEAAEDWARERGCHEVRIRSNVVREEAFRFYAGRGYRVHKTQRVFVRLCGESRHG